jgi:glycosyltransferase involved in cell wall biosynthesis
MAQIQILMATYNGEKYIQQQLDSLLAQTNQDWELLIRDDNSTDSTQNIIAKFQAKHPGKVSIIRDHPDGQPNKQLGPAQNFGRLLEQSSAPYVMFADQDDVWHPDKILRSLKKIKSLEKIDDPKKPLLVYSDFALSDSQNNILAESANRAWNLRLANNGIRRLLIEEPVYGMTMLFNRSLVKKVLHIPATASMHDSWVTKVAALTGKVGYIDRSLADHRLHETNVTVFNNPKLSLYERVSNALTDGITNSLIGKQTNYSARMKYSANMAEILLKQYRDEITPQNRQLLAACVDLPSQPFLKRPEIILRNRLLPNDYRYALETLIFSALPPSNGTKSRG